MATKFITPSWRMPKNSNQSKASNYSLDFDGSSQSVETTLSPVSYTGFSISAWVYADSLGAYNVVASQYRNSDATNSAWFLETIGSNMAFGVGSGGSALYATKAFSTSGWYHITGVWNGSTVEVYIDGVASGSPVSATSMNTGTVNMGIGALWNTAGTAIDNGFWDGKITQLAIFDYALSTGSISALYNGGIPSNPLAVTTPPIAYYDLGQGSAYASGSAGIVEPNLAAATGSTVFEFDGSSDEIVVSNDAALQINGDITISAWVYAESDTGRVVSKRGGGGTNYDFYIESRYLRLYDGGTGPFSTGRITLNQWTHVLISVTSGTGTYYIDNVAAGTGTFSISSVGTSQPFFIGGAYTPVLANFDGKMSNVQIWNESLTAAEVLTLYNNGTPLQSNIPQSGSLKAWYKLGLDTSNWDGSDWVIGDSVSQFATAYSIPNTNNDNNVSPYGGNSKLISGGSFLGVADSILVPSASVLSISCWVKLDNPDVNFYDNIISQVNGATAHSFRIMKWRNNGTGNWTFGTINFALYSNGTTAVNVNVDKAQFTPQANTWFNIICTYDGTTMRVFINNKLCGSGTSMSGDFAGNTNNRFIIGKNANSIYGGLQGAVSNVQVWNSTLTGGDGLSVGDQGVGEIAQLYNNGTPLASSIPQASSLLGWWKLESDLNDYSGNNKTLTAYGNEGGNANSISPVPSAISSLVSTLNGESSGMDSTNLVPSNLIKSIPYSGYSMEFDGTSNEYINCGHAALTAISGGSNTLSTSMSVSMWFKLGSSSSSRGLINFGSLGNTYGGFTIRHQSSVFSFLKESTHLVSGGYTFTNTSEWHHMAFVYDPSSASNCYLYIDGVDTGVSFVNVGNLSFQNSNLTNRNLIIGAYYGDADTFTGSISNCSIYNKLLTTNQVLTIYNGGVPNSISSLSPVGWWSLGADSYFNGSDWIYPDLSTNSNNGTSVDMGAENLKGFGPNSLANGTSTNLDLATDLIGEAPGSTGNAISINMNSLARTGSTP